jgi:hypothetical protein
MNNSFGQTDAASNGFIKVLFFSIMFLLIVFAVEAMSQLLFVAWYGRFPWAVERFNVRAFMQPVDDARHITMIPNFADPNYEGHGISTDAWGFRRGTHATDPSCPNVVFIGDSVPFGWGVPDTATMPSKFFDRMRIAGTPRCVVNAAIPSYSLFQAVARLELEILGKIKADVVYLQVYDPVWHFVVFGPRWKPESDWTTAPVLPRIELPLSRYSASIAILQRAMDRVDDVELFPPVDSKSMMQFRLAIRGELGHLHNVILRAGVRQLIVAPLTVPPSSYGSLSGGHRLVVDALNDELHQFAAANQDTIFADTIEWLNKIPESEVFIDACCHLSERANDVIAEHLVQLLQQNPR